MAIALALVVAGNAWVGYRLEALLEESDLQFAIELQRRVDAFPHPERVQVLIAGTSQAMTALRPAQVAVALGLPPDAAFSIALPGASMLDTTLLLERYRPRFPNLRHLILGIGVASFTMQSDTLTRYLTRGSGGARWRYAQWQPQWDNRAALMLSRYFPVLDFRANLLATLLREPGRFMPRLVGREVPSTEEFARLRAADYPGGAPPPWETWTASERAVRLKEPWFPIAIMVRVGIFFPADADDRIRLGAAQFDALLDAAEAAHLDVDVVEMPIFGAMAGVIARKHARAYAAYQRVSVETCRAHGLAILKPPPGLVRADFYDPDHVNTPGAQRFAEALAPRLRRPER